MEAKIKALTPAAELARDNPFRIPNESAKYRAARTALLAEEIELRRHIERGRFHTARVESRRSMQAPSPCGHSPPSARRLRQTYDQGS